MKACAKDIVSGAICQDEHGYWGVLVAPRRGMVRYFDRWDAPPFDLNGDDVLDVDDPGRYARPGGKPDPRPR